MFLEERIVGQVAAQVIIMPEQFALDPRFVRDIQADPVRFPGFAGTFPQAGQVISVIFQQRSKFHTLWQVTVGKVQHSTFTRCQIKLPFNQESGPVVGVGQLSRHGNSQQVRRRCPAFPEEGCLVGQKTIRLSIQ